MIEQGTLDIYTKTQLINFGFILAMACMGFFVCTFISCASREASWGRRIGIIAGIAVVAGAICDAIENLWSFVMLANPTGFANWLAIPYSAFATAKFALLTLGMLATFTSLVLAIIGQTLKQPKLG